MLAADFIHLDKYIQMVNERPAEWFNLDNRDVVFVHNNS
ncbi:hypothetical protein [Ornithobacterium rhinotracheale]